jgi:hypothetical protein
MKRRKFVTLLGGAGAAWPHKSMPRSRPTDAAEIAWPEFWFSDASEHERGVKRFWSRFVSNLERKIQLLRRGARARTCFLKSAPSHHL